MGMSEKAYTIAWIITAYIRVGVVLNIYIK